MKDKIPNILFFLIIILGGIALYFAFGGNPAITPNNLPADDIEKIEITNYIDEKEIVLTDKPTIDSLISLLYKSKPIEIDNPAISKDYFYLKIYKLHGETESIRLAESKKEGRYHSRSKFNYRNDVFFDMVNQLF
jgi:hypothetical protein